MSAFEQKIEVPDRNYQYLIFAADPYDNIAFKIPSAEVIRDVSEDARGRMIVKWEPERKSYYVWFIKWWHSISLALIAPSLFFSSSKLHLKMFQHQKLLNQLPLSKFYNEFIQVSKTQLLFQSNKHFFLSSISFVFFFLFLHSQKQNHDVFGIV